MVNLFLDTDVCLDVLLLREPFYMHSNQVFQLQDTVPYIFLNISESCLPNLIYFTKEKHKISNANNRLIHWVESCGVHSSNKTLILNALHSNFKDKEDAIQYFTALHSEADYFITRNKKDYEPHTSTLPVYTPAEFLSKIIN